MDAGVVEPTVTAITVERRGVLRDGDAARARGHVLLVGGRDVDRRRDHEGGEGARFEGVAALKEEKLGEQLEARRGSELQEEGKRRGKERKGEAGMKVKKKGLKKRKIEEISMRI